MTTRTWLTMDEAIDALVALGVDENEAIGLLESADEHGGTVSENGIEIRLSDPTKRAENYGFIIK